MDLLRGNIKTLYFKYLSAALAWIGLILFERPLLTFFGADETLLALAHVKSQISSNDCSLFSGS